MKEKLISIDIFAKFGFFKKPDTNENIYFTYNWIHKPALLGIFGAIIGMGGYYQAFEKKQVRNKKQEKKVILPEFFTELNDMKVGITPLSPKGYFQKQVVTYNNSVGYANLQGGMLNISEQMLINPRFKVYLLLDADNNNHNLLYNNLKKQECEFIPYMGKNDFQLWWRNFQEYEYDNEIPEEFIVSTLFPNNNEMRLRNLGETPEEGFFMSFENLPISYNEVTGNYLFHKYSFTNMEFENTNSDFFKQFLSIHNGKEDLIIHVN